MKFISDRFFQATATSSDSTAAQLENDLLPPQSAGHHKMDHVAVINHSDDVHLNKHGNLIISPKSEIL